MSTTKDLGIAVRYSLSAHSLVFKVSVTFSCVAQRRARAARRWKQTAWYVLLEMVDQ